MISRRFYYIASLIFVFGIPTVVAWASMGTAISPAALGVFVGIVMVIGSLWDIWATRHGRRDRVWLWQFNFKDNLGIKIFDLPVEEYLFYIFASLYTVFIWEAIQLALRTGQLSSFILIVFMGVWSLVSVLFPYLVRPRGDKL